MVAFGTMVLKCYLCPMSKKNDNYTLSVRLPKQVAVALRKRAKAQNRSINAQIIQEITSFGLLEAVKQPVGIPA